MGLAADKPIDHPHLPWTVYAYGSDGFAREPTVPRNPNVMGYPFPPNTRAMSFFFFFPFSFGQISLFVSVTNPSFFEPQPTIQKHEELVWLVGNLKLEVTNYLRELYGLGGVAYPGGGDDDDGEEDLEATPSYWSRKRWHH